MTCDRCDRPVADPAREWTTTIGITVGATAVEHREDVCRCRRCVADECAKYGHLWQQGTPNCFRCGVDYHEDTAE